MDFLDGGSQEQDADEEDAGASAMSGLYAALGFYVTLEEPTKPMLAEALSAGYYKAASGVGKSPRPANLRGRS